MSFSTLFIKEPKDWGKISEAVIALTQCRATVVQLIGDHGDMSDDPTTVDVVVMQLKGAADWALEIYWKGMAQLAHDTIGMYIAYALQVPVLVPDADPSSAAWLRLLPNGIFEEITLDLEQLSERSVVTFELK